MQGRRGGVTIADSFCEFELEKVIYSLNAFTSREIRLKQTPEFSESERGV